MHRNLRKLCGSLGLKFPGARAANTLARPLGTRWIQIGMKDVTAWLDINDHLLNTIKGTWNSAVGGLDRLNSAHEGTLSEEALGVRDVLQEMLKEGVEDLPEYVEMGVSADFNAVQRKVVRLSRRNLLTLMRHGTA